MAVAQGQLPVGGAFHTSLAPFDLLSDVNILDTGNGSITPGQSGRSSGGVCLGVVETGLSIAEQIVITGWSISFYGMLIRSQAATNPTWGVLGKVLAGLIIGASTVPQALGLAGTGFIPPPPESLPYIETLWDGANDPVFPSYQPGDVRIPGAGFVAQSFQTPQPVVMRSGDQLGIGMWLTSSLLTNNFWLAIRGASYTIY